MKNVIYKIVNSVNNKIYIGSAIYFNSRKAQHKHNLINKTHHNRILQNFVNKYGFDCIDFIIIEKDCKDLIAREQFYIDTLNPFFNIRRVAESMKGTKRTKEQKEYMISQRLKKSGYKKGWKHSPEALKKIGNAHRGKVISEAQKKLISITSKGREVSEETRKNISKKLKEYEITDSHRKKLSESAKGNTNWKNVDYKNPDRNKKISEAMRKRQSKKVINTETGKIYNSAKEASISIGIPESTFCKHLNGKTKKNKTPFRYA